MTAPFNKQASRRSGSLMQRYCDQLGSIASHNRVQIALKAARVSAELAATSATDAMLAAQAANRAKSEFLANMSHELRTPLNAIMGFSQIIAEETLGPIGTGKYIEYSRDINGSAQHLLAIINDILDLARIEAGKSELNEEPLDPQMIVNSCIRVVSERAKIAGVTINFDPARSNFLFRGDERKLKQVLINLLSNAVKFTLSGGTIDVQWHLITDRCAQLTVADTGIGIAPADLARVLQPFAQAESGLNRRYEGTGLGLPLTRGLVELHGGTFCLESELGRGTKAIVELPLTRVHSIHAHTPAAEPTPTASSRSPVHQALRALEQTIRTGFSSGGDHATE
ncbi:MAG TPA: HAMP domain-containing sensor histidine kinase [Stellaceae bacterium]|jgi:signal transduction histidine kinase|nr:HAMP domain-containing sensor histidine kinase [Stellaceae bacterium]